MNLTQPETYATFPQNKPFPGFVESPIAEGISATGDYSERPWMTVVHDGCDDFRRAIIIAHRRAGKTVGMCAQLIRDLFRCPHKRPQVAYIAPTAKQAKTVAWAYFVDMLADVPGCKFRRHELIIEVDLGERGIGTIYFASGENYDRLRGMYLDAAVCDEYADLPEALIPDVLLPALADRDGKLYIIGTVRGFNHLWKQYLAALDNPRWYAGIFRPDDTHELSDRVLADLQADMDEDSYRQEMLCDPTAASRGSYWGKTLGKYAHQVRDVPYDQDCGVTLAFDLGIADSTAVWHAQLLPGGEIHLIDYTEYQNTGFLDILEELKRLPYQVTRWIGPHDLNVRDYATGQSRIDAAASVGVHFEIAPKLLVIDGIESVRRALPRCWFDEIKCKDGLVCLQQYRSEYDEKRRVLSRNPVHDWASHGADAFRYLITGTDGGKQSQLALPPLQYGRRGNVQQIGDGYRRGRR